MIRFVVYLFLFSILVSAARLNAQSFEPLPEPLSLEFALQQAADVRHFVMVDAQSAIESARADKSFAESRLGFRAQIDLEAAYIEPSSTAFDQSNNDSSASLRLIKPIYDFSGSEEKISAANTVQFALEENLDFIIAQRKIDIARQFFAVILSDLKYVWDNEAMAIAFVGFDAEKDRYALSQISDVELLEAESRYQDILHTRSLSEINQRHSRAVLAESLNRPTQLPTNLKIPDINFANFKLPEYQQLLDMVVKNNPDIKLAEQQLLAAQQRLAAENKQMYPRIDAEVKASEYARQTGSRDELRAQLNVVIPLYENTTIKTNIARARASMLKQRSRLLQIKSNVRQQALRLWQDISVLETRHNQLLTSQDFRELNLDRSRALYEMEVKTDLGDSMVAVSELQYRQAENKFARALAWMQLRLLSGKTDILHATLEAQP